MTGIFSFVKFFRRGEWALTIAVFFLTVTQVWLDLEIPSYMAAITDVITAHGTTDEVIAKSFAMVACALASLAVGLAISIIVGWISSSVAKTIREKQFNHVQKFSFNEIDSISSYSLITRSTNDVKQIQNFIGTTLESLMRAPILCTWAILRISAGNISWTAATLISVTAMVMLVVIILRLSAPLFKKVQKLNDGLNHITMEKLTGQKIIRAFNAQETEGERFDDASYALSNNHIKANHVMAANVPFNGLIRNVLAMVIYWLGAFILAGTSDVDDRLTLFADMIVFSTYAIMVLNGFRNLVQIFNVFPRAKVSLERIDEVLRTEPTVVGGSVRDGDGSGSISFKDVSFRYINSQSDILSGISFDVRPGETVAIIGATGCGKTTLANLIPRFYDCIEGAIEVDGVNVKEYDLDSLREKIGFVSQRATILSGTVRDNVNYGKHSDERTDDDVWRALDIACIKDFIAKEGGLDINLSEEGRNISGGQKQRISIARAVCKKPRIYVFDDCFSAIDFRTDLEVRRRLRKETRDCTVLLVTQRVGTARSANKIIVMDEGRVVGMGTHDELLESCTLYREIAESQRTGDEI